MAVGGTSGTSNNGSLIDVNSIVEGLMAARQAPLKTLEQKISQRAVTISVLGTFATKLGTLHDAISELESGSNFLTKRSSSANDAVAAATGSASVLANLSGSYVVQVNKLAVPAYDADGDGISDPGDVTAQNGLVYINGREVTPSTNEFVDSVTGLSFVISGTGTTSVRISSDVASQGKSMIQSFVAAYNDLVSYYQSTISSAPTSGEAPDVGALRNNSTIRSLMSELATLYISGNRYKSGNTWLSASSFREMGISLQSGGLLSLNESKLDSALAGQLGGQLSAGLRFGYQSESVSLSTRLGDARYSLLPRERKSTEDSLRVLSLDKSRIESNLATIRTQYIAQYAALDAQLAKFQSLGNSLSSMLLGLQQNNR